MIGAFLLRYKLHVYRQDSLGGGGVGKVCLKIFSLVHVY